MPVVQQRLTLEAFLQLPEEKPALEFDDGVVTQKMSPKARHSVLQGSLVERINRFAVPLKLAYAFPELRTTFAGVSRVPDVAVYRWERITRTADGEPVDDVVEPPDIAIEIVSSEQSVKGQIRRCLWFVANGVRIALLVDPADHSVMRFTPNAVPAELHGSDRINLDKVLPGFQLTVDQLFASLRLA